MIERSVRPLLQVEPIPRGADVGGEAERSLDIFSLATNPLQKSLMQGQSNREGVKALQLVAKAPHP